MTEQNINAYCTICGKGYHLCQSCQDTKTFRSWRTVVDNLEHYKIYSAIHGYTILKNKGKAKSELENCDLSELATFNPEIKSVIEEIISDDNPVVKTKSVPRSKKKVETVKEDVE